MNAPQTVTLSHLEGEEAGREDDGQVADGHLVEVGAGGHPAQVAQQVGQAGQVLARQQQQGRQQTRFTLKKESQAMFQIRLDVIHRIRQMDSFMEIVWELCKSGWASTLAAGL